MRVVVRAVREGDLAAVMALLRMLAELEGGAETLAATEEMLREAWFGEAPMASARVAEVEGELVGVATYFEAFSTGFGKGIWLDDLYVVETWRGRGVGRMLLAEVARLGMARGCRWMEWMVAEKNVRGMAFYVRHGGSVRRGYWSMKLGREEMRLLAIE